MIRLTIVVTIALLYALTANAETIEYTAPVEIPHVEKTIEEKIRETFPDAPIMLEVARCESGLKNVPSPTGDHGIFQINQVHLSTLNELGLDRTDVDDNIKFARILYDQSGLKPWNNSKHCWNK